MPDLLTPMSGVTADKFLPKLKYEIDTIAQNMFSAPVRKDKKLMVQPTTLKGVTIQKLWDSVFANKSDFLQRYHNRRKETDLVVGDWNYASDKGSGYRFVSLVTLVDVPRAGTPTPLNEAHRFVYMNTEDGKVMLVYQISSQTPSVPAGGSFRTEAYCEILAASADADCSIAIWGNCRKMSLTFSAIQYIASPRAIKEMTAAYLLMVGMIQEDLCGGPQAVTTLPGDDVGGASDAAAGSASGGGGGDSGDGDGGGDGTPSSGVFQGVLLVLAFVVALAVVRSMIVVNRTAGQAARILSNVGSLESGSRSYGSDSGMAKGPGNMGAGPAASSFPLTEEQALMSAAREAQVQTLRYRWLEQRTTLTEMQGSLATMRWMVYLQWIAIITLIVKVFFL